MVCFSTRKGFRHSIQRLCEVRGTTEYPLSFEAVRCGAIVNWSMSPGHNACLRTRRFHTSVKRRTNDVFALEVRNRRMPQKTLNRYRCRWFQFPCDAASPARAGFVPGPARTIFPLEYVSFHQLRTCPGAGPGLQCAKAVVSRCSKLVAVIRSPRRRARARWPALQVRALWRS
jgi:hypothetical protein